MVTIVLPSSLVAGCPRRMNSDSRSESRALFGSTFTNGGAPATVSNTTEVVNADSIVAGFKLTITAARVVAVPTTRIDRTGVSVFSLQFKKTKATVAPNKSKKPTDAATIITVAMRASFRMENLLISMRVWRRRSEFWKGYRPLVRSRQDKMRGDEESVDHSTGTPNAITRWPCVEWRPVSFLDRCLRELAERDGRARFPVRHRFPAQAITKLQGCSQV